MPIYSNEHVNSFEEDNVMKLYNVQTDYKVKKKAKQIKSEMSSETKLTITRLFIAFILLTETWKLIITPKACGY